MTILFYPGQEDYITELNKLAAIAELTAGAKGWSPLLLPVEDGLRLVLQISDWTGGEGVKPATGQYLALTGLTSDISQATDIRGTPGNDGTDGTDGTDGAAATVAVGTVTTGAPDSSAVVTNSGTSSAAVFDFTLPQGPQGAPGADGTDGADGTSATVSVGTVSTVAAGSPATVTNSGTPLAAVFDFEIPQGPQGDPGLDGVDGAAATVSVGTVTTGAPGSSATVTNSGTSAAAVLDFTIPAGADGAGSGDVVGPTSATDGNLALFDGTTGKLLKEGLSQTSIGDPVSLGTADKTSLVNAINEVNAKAGQAADKAVYHSAVQPLIAVVPTTMTSPTWYDESVPPSAGTYSLTRGLVPTSLTYTPGDYTGTFTATSVTGIGSGLVMTSITISDDIVVSSTNITTSAVNYANGDIVSFGTGPWGPELKAKIALNTNNDLATHTIGTYITGSENTSKPAYNLNNSTFINVGPLTPDGAKTNSVAIGRNALASGNGNATVAVGLNALPWGVGAGNVAVGANALYTAYSANSSVAIGQSAAFSTRTTSETVAIGSACIFNALTVSNTVALGSNAGYYLKVTSSDVLIGTNAGRGEGYYAASGGSRYSSSASNVAIGKDSMAYAFGQNNVAIGFCAMFGATGTTAAFGNTTLGFQTLAAVTSGSYNAAVGYRTLAAVTSGGYNIAVGYNTGTNITSESNNIIVGNSSDVGSGVSNALVIGNAKLVSSNYGINIGGVILRSGSSTPLVIQNEGNRVIVQHLQTTAYYETVQSSNSGTGYSVTLSLGTIQDITLTGNVTYTFPDATANAGASFTLFQTQDGTGGRTVTWPGSVVWAAGTAPTITGTAKRTDEFIFTAVRGKWVGRVVGKNYNLT